MEHITPPGREPLFRVPYVAKPPKFRAAFLDRVRYTESLTSTFLAMTKICKANESIDPLAVFQFHFSLHRTEYEMILQRECPGTALHECMASNGGWHEDIGLLQEWMFFALLEYALQGSVDRDDFLAKRDDGSTVYNTSALNDYLLALKSKNPIPQDRDDSDDGAVSQALNEPERSAIPAAVVENVQRRVPINLDGSEDNDSTVLAPNKHDPAAALEQPNLSDLGAHSEDLDLGERNPPAGTSTDEEERATGGTSDGEHRRADSNAPNDIQRRGAANAIETVLQENLRFLRVVSGYLKQCQVFLDRRIDSGGVSHVTRLQSFSETLGQCQMLGAILHDAICYVAAPMTQWPANAAILNTAPTIKRQTWASTYCPWFRSTFLSEDHPLEWALYVLSLGTMRKQLDHTRCTARVCIASNTASGQNLQHTRPNCSCDVVEVLHQILASILRRGIIPFVRLRSQDDGQICCDIVELNGDEPYVALSHVWIDGLGDQARNIIASCQLRRIVEGLTLLAKRFTLNSSTLPAFWLDALCIPAGVENEEYQRFRDFSISQMHRIYANASATLILDPDLWCLPASATASETMIKLYISVHAARLWTYQETTLCPTVYALGKGCIHDLRGLKNRLERELLLGSIPTYALGFHQRLLGLDGTTTAQELDPNHILCAICSRTSSRPDDECICIATLMGIDTGPLTAAAPADRMPILLRSMLSIPVAALFAFGPRLELPGLRWAPESFLTAFRGGIDPDFDLWSATRFTAHLAPNDQGLCVDLPAIKLGLAGWWESEGRFHFALGSGTLGFRRVEQSGKWERPAQLEVLRLLRAHHQVGDLRFSSSQFEIEAYDGPRAGPKTESAVLVPSKPTYTGKHEIGVLVELRHGQASLESSCTAHEDVVVCRWCCVVEMYSVPENEQHRYKNIVHDLRAEWIPSQRWLVDGPSSLSQPMPSTEDSVGGKKRPYDHGDSSPPYKRQET